MYVVEALNAILASKDLIHNRTVDHCNAGLAGGAITEQEHRKEIWLSKNNRIEQRAKVKTEGTAELRDKYIKKKQYWRQLRDQYDEDTNKCIKIFTEYLGPSARSITDPFVRQLQFEEAIIQLDGYYNINVKQYI